MRGNSGFESRAYLLDVTDRCPNRRTMQELVDVLARFGYTEFCLYDTAKEREVPLETAKTEAYCRMQTPNYSLAAKDLTTLRSARYLSGGNINLTADNWIDQIAAERVRELYMEGFRLHDYKRWGKLYKGGEGFTRTPQLNTLDEGSSLSVKADNPLFVWPIPQHEIESPGSMVQPNESNK